MVWPRVHAAPDAALLALSFQLEQTQWWPAERLLEAQLLQLRALLRHAYAHAPFHRARMAELDFDPYADFGWDDFARLPRFTRRELQQNGENLDGRKLLAGHGEFLAATSSGSTGLPVSFYSTGVTRLMWQALTLRDHLWRRRDFSLKLASIGDFAQAMDLPNWGNPVASVAPTGAAAVFPIEEPAARQVAWLLEQKPGYVLTYATNLDALLRHCAARGIRLPGLREARSFAESLPPYLREFCRDTWGVPLTDMYSSREAGYIALQCPESPVYHVQSENLLLEVLDAHGRACEPGQSGSVVLTVLNNFATPLIRYEIGDVAVPGTRCSCGRALPVLERVIGRVRNLLTLPDGEQRYPDFGVDFYGALEPVSQFQIVEDAASTRTPRRHHATAYARGRGRDQTAAQSAVGA
jgi:phenylacetate-CoA ligase